MTDASHYRMYIDGQWRDAADSIQVTNPATGQLVATVAHGDISTVEDAVAAAKTADASGVWRNLPPNARADPFGGVKQSGLGRELGPDALDEYTEPKFIHIDLTNDRRKRAYAVVVSAAAQD